MKLANLSTLVITRLAAPLREVVETILLASDRPVFAVGGAVRDLLLGRPLRDIDLAVDGDAIALARRVGEAHRLRTTVHERFGTAILRTSAGIVDLATSRAESYSGPARLPTVRPAPIDQDLARRDFTVNAMAIPLGRSGDLIDPFGGREDLERRLVRALHERSFIDDPTRSFRACRYAARLGFTIEERTACWITRDREHIALLSPARLRAEIFAILREQHPGPALALAEGLGLLQAIAPELALTPALTAALDQMSNATPPQEPATLGCALLASALSPAGARSLVARLGLPRRPAEAVLAMPAARIASGAIAGARVPPSAVTSTLDGRPEATLWALALTTPAPTLRIHVISYLTGWRGVRPATPASDLECMGLKGPEIGHWLRRLRDARIDGEIDAEGERAWLAKQLGSGESG